MTSFPLHLLGMLLMVLSGGGVGVSLYWKKQENWHQIRCFVHFLEYLLLAIQYQAIPGEELLWQAAQRPEFATLQLHGCENFAQISPPAGLAEGAKAELTQGLARLVEVPHEAACRTLEQLLVLCRRYEKEAGGMAAQARALYPKLGFCVGLMAAIFFA